MSLQPHDINLLVTNFPFKPADVERLRAAVGAHALLTTRSRQALIEALTQHPETDVICVYAAPDNLLDLAPRLGWVALSSAGAEHVLAQPWASARNAPIITTANGVHAVSISEHVFSGMLLWARHWPEMLELQRERRWPAGGFYSNELIGRELDGATLLVVGLGAIGRRVAQLGRAFGMRTLATRRSAASGASDPDVDALYPLDQLDEAVAQADYIVLAVPSTPETQGMINAERLAHVRPGALLVNIARGAVVDEPALLAALREGRLGGAVLDVVAQEPLPPDSPLWTAPNVVISPHVSGRSVRYSERLTDLMLDNIARYRDGRPLRNVVDVARGY
jgi:phosphoglycerate dehydrogenase-like enzyme